MMKVEINLAELSNALLNHHTSSYVIDEGNGYYDFDFPIASIKSDDVSLALVHNDVVTKLVKELITKIDNNTSKALKPIFKEINDLKSEIQKLQKENDELREINQDYKDNYGEYIAPSIILSELYNGGRVAKDTQLVQKSKWKTKYLKSPKYSKGISYWLNLFEDWGIFKSYGRGEKFANYSYGKALNLIYYKIKKEKVKEIKDDER
jgi:regulator of replication initiation timing